MSHVTYESIVILLISCKSQPHLFDVFSKYELVGPSIQSANRKIVSCLESGIAQQDARDHGPRACVCVCVYLYVSMCVSVCVVNMHIQSLCGVHYEAAEADISRIAALLHDCRGRGR